VVAGQGVYALASLDECAEAELAAAAPAQASALGVSGGAVNGGWVVVMCTWKLNEPPVMFEWASSAPSEPVDTVGDGTGVGMYCVALAMAELEAAPDRLLEAATASSPFPGGTYCGATPVRFI
jgi:hypothetical protein